MDVKAINNAIPAEWKVDLKRILANFKTDKFNIGLAAPAASTTAAPALAPAVIPVTLTEGSLEDGTVIKYDTPTLATGSMVTMVSPNGEMPMSAGTYKLTDGTEFTCDETGKVTAVTPAAAPAVEPVANNIAPQLASLKAEIEEKFELKESFNKQVSDLKAENVKLRSEVAEFIQLFSNVLDLPSGNPIETPKNKSDKQGLLARRIKQ